MCVGEREVPVCIEPGVGTPGRRGEPLDLTSSLLEITNVVVRLKEELENMREQIQNLE